MKVALCLTAFLLSVALFPPKAEASSTDKIHDQALAIIETVKQLLEGRGNPYLALKNGFAKVKEMFAKLREKVHKRFDGDPPALIINIMDRIQALVQKLKIKSVAKAQT